MKTPCIGICSTVYGDTVCRGCKRYFDEIISWNQLSEAEKTAIDRRLAENAQKLLPEHLEITNITQLEQALKDRRIRYRPDQPPETWALQWLRFGDPKVNLLNVGLKAHHPELSVLELFKKIDGILYQMACKAFDCRQPLACEPEPE